LIKKACTQEIATVAAGLLNTRGKGRCNSALKGHDNSRLFSRVPRLV